MTGAGSGSLAFVKEDSFDTLPGMPTYFLPGRNPTITDLSLSRQLQRLRTPSNAEAVDSLAGNLDGAFTVSFGTSEDTHDDVRDIVFNDSGTGFTTGLAPTSSWYLGINPYLDSSDTEQTVERHLQACIPLEYTINYQQGQNQLRETLTMGYADENRNTSITPSSITAPSDGNDAAFFGADLTINSNAVNNRLQSFTLRFAGPLYRFHRGTSPTATSAVLANPQTTLQMNAILETKDHLEIAYGGATGTTSVSDTLSQVSGSLALDSGGAAFATYTLSELKSNQYSWNDLIAADADLTEDIEWWASGGISIA